MNRKDRLLRNLGEGFKDTSELAQPYFDGPNKVEVRTSVVMVERILKSILLDEVDRLAGNIDECRRFFQHFFDPTAGAEERERFVANFVRTPPRVVIGYPRTGAELPLFSIILSSDEETDAPSGFLGKFAGETIEGENPIGGEDAEYEGGYFTQVYSIFIYAQNPDQTAYLYQTAKSILYGAGDALKAAGVIDPRYSGGELNPEEMYLPDNVFARVLTVRLISMMTVPKLFAHRDGRRLRITGIFMEDAVVEGVRGGVKVYAEESDGED